MLCFLILEHATIVGITNADKRIMVALRSSIRLEVPLGDVGHIMVSSEYVRYLVDIANAKMSSNKQRTDKLYDDLLSKVFCK